MEALDFTLVVMKPLLNDFICIYGNIIRLEYWNDLRAQGLHHSQSFRYYHPGCHETTFE